MAARSTGLLGSRRSLGRDLAAQPGDEELDDLPVCRCQFGRLGGCAAGLLLDLFHHVDQHLGGARVGARRLVDHLLDDRLALADPAPLAVDGDVDLLVQGGDQERGQALAARAARVAGLTLLEGPAPRRLAIADRVISLGLGHVASHISWYADVCGPPVAAAERASY